MMGIMVRQTNKVHKQMTNCTKKILQIIHKTQLRFREITTNSVQRRSAFITDFQHFCLQFIFICRNFCSFLFLSPDNFFWWAGLRRRHSPSVSTGQLILERQLLWPLATPTLTAHCCLMQQCCTFPIII